MLPDRNTIENEHLDDDRKHKNKILAYKKFYDGYVKIIDEIENPKPQKYKINKRLINSLDEEIKNIFDTS